MRSSPKSPQRDARSGHRRWGIALLIVAYYVSSTLNSCLAKQILNEWPRPLTVTIVQQALSSLGGVWQVLATATRCMCTRIICFSMSVHPHALRASACAFCRCNSARASA